MSDDLSGLADLEAIANATLRKMAGPQRRKLLRRMGQTIRGSQAKRIAAQQNPDGSAYAPRKSKATGKAQSKKGSIRRGKMFRKMRQYKYLQIGTDAEGLWVGYSGAASRVGNVHQDGEFDKPNPNAKPMRYPRRILLGLTEADRDELADMLLAQLSGA